MELAEIFTQIGKEFQARRDTQRQTLRNIYASDATVLVLRDAVVIAGGRVPRGGEMALAAARMMVRFERFDRALMDRSHCETFAVRDTAFLERGIGVESPTYQADCTAWMKTEERGVRRTVERPIIEASGLPQEVIDDLLVALASDEITANARSTMGDWCRGLREAIPALKLPERITVDDRAERINFETLARNVEGGWKIFACRSSIDQRIDCAKKRFIAPANGEADDPSVHLCNGEDLWELANPYGRAAVMRLFDAMGVDPLGPPSAAYLWRGPSANEAQWHLFEANGRTILFAINLMDMEKSQVLALHGGVGEAVAWMTKWFSFRGEPVPIANPQPLADVLQVRRHVEHYREFQATLAAAQTA